MEEYQKNGFVISTDPGKLDVTGIHAFLKNSYWAKNIPFQVVQKSIQHSLCFGLYQGEQQIGFARVVTDYATFAYLGDVFVLQGFRSQGLGKWLVETIVNHPALQGLRRWILATRDAHSFYCRFGFQRISRPERLMELSDPVYDR